MQDPTIPPLADRIRAGIAVLGENYSKSAAQVALGLLREALPFVDGHAAGEREALSLIGAVVAEQVARADAPRESIPRDYTLPASTRSVFRGESGGGEVHITTSEAGQIAQVISHDVGPEPEPSNEPENARQNIDLFRREAALIKLADQRGVRLGIEMPGGEPDLRLRHAQAVAECLWHTLRRISELDPGDFEHTEAGALGSYLTEVRRLAARRDTFIAGLPADETISDGAWLGLAPPPDDITILRGILRRVHEVFENLQPGNPGRLGGACQLFLAGWRPDMSVEDAGRLLAKRQQDEMPACTGEVEPGEKAVETRFVELFYVVGEHGEPRTGLRFEGLPDLYIPDTEGLDIKHALLTQGVTRPPPALVDAKTEPKRGDLPAIAAPGRLFVAYHPPVDKLAQSVRCALYYATGDEVWLVDQGHLNLHSLLVARLGTIVELHLQQPGGPQATAWPAKAPTPTNASTVLKAIDDAADLGERAAVTASNITAVLGLPEGKQLGSPVRDILVIAGNLLAQIGEAMKSDDQFYWLVDEYCDNEGETFGIAIPNTPEVDAALEKWARSYEAIIAAEESRRPDPEPYEVRLGRSGDALTFRRYELGRDLEAIENASENDYSSRIRMLKPEGVELLLKAIAGLPEGASLSLYKGTLSTCYLDEAQGPPKGIADLWKYCVDPFEDDGEGDVRDDRGDHHHPDDMAIGGDDEDEEVPTPEQVEQRDAENEGNMEEFLRATAVPEGDEP